MKQVIFAVIILVICGVANVYASTASANHGHHGGDNHGALGMAAHGSQSGASSNGAASGGNGDAGDCDFAHYVLCGKGN